MRPRALDLCCSAGGASVGYHQAGWDVTGVDIRHQPHYPFEFHHYGAVEFVEQYGHMFDLIHASPPCQGYTKGAKQHGTESRHDTSLIAALRKSLIKIGKPFVIENVYEAKSHLVSPIMLCGTMFDLGVFRHRLFEMGLLDIAPPPHGRHSGRIGDGKYVTVAGHTGGSSARDALVYGSLREWSLAMGIDWMTAAELKEAIPPAYTQYLGSQILRGHVGMHTLLSSA